MPEIQHFRLSISGFPDYLTVKDVASLILSVAEVRRKIGGSYGGHELISVSLNE
jgi:hypothetical protein